MNEYTVYFGELYEILMALELVEDHDYLNSTGPVHIFVDNEASLQASHRPKQGAGQYILKRIVELHHDLIAKHKITLHWIPAHEGIPGNELADVMAKEATGWRKKGDGATAPRPPGLRTLTSASRIRLK